MRTINPRDYRQWIDTQQTIHELSGYSGQLHFDPISARGPEVLRLDESERRALIYWHADEMARFEKCGRRIVAALLCFAALALLAVLI